MYTKQEISKQKQAFWTAFGRYMKPVLSADGEPIGWLNYKTGNKWLQFRMDVDSRRAVVAVVLDHPDPGVRGAYLERMRQVRVIFESEMGERDWTWQADGVDEHGRAVGMVTKVLNGVNIFRAEDWPAIISFLKPRAIAFDSFWSLVRYQFSNLI
jgi:hypothetical protein